MRIEMPWENPAKQDFKNSKRKNSNISLSSSQMGRDFPAEAASGHCVSQSKNRRSDIDGAFFHSDFTLTGDLIEEEE